MADTVPENAPHNCPGPESENAGKADACQGCPNQATCSAKGNKGPDPDLPLINERMALVKHRILVLSGKGGVGKSTFASQLSLSFSKINDGNVQVGLLDLDLCGPSIPRMMGLEDEQLHQSNLGWTPSYYDDNLAVMSVGFMLPNPDDAVIWRGPRKNGLIKQFLKDVNWGDVDFLIIDTPPGTSDEHLSVVTYLKEAGIDGAVVITTPQDVSIVDVRKEISFCKKTGIPILGIVENMSGFVCPKCSTQTHIFKPTSGGGEVLAKQCDVPFLGRVPLDPRLMQACENGQSIADFAPDSPAVAALNHIVTSLIKTLLPNQSPDSGEMAD